MNDTIENANIEIDDWEAFLKKSKPIFENKFHQICLPELSKQDFQTLDTLGVGAFGKVVLSRRKTDNKYVAIKILDKPKIIKLKQVKHCLNEKRILQSISFPFCINLECFFQDNRYLYYTLPLVLGGDLFRQLKLMKRFNESQTKFFGGQVLLALEYLHHLDLIYRDLKPENILLDLKGYIKLADFGFCKYVKGRTYTFCGTPEYLAPEIILNKGYDKSVDWWSFGVLLYEMITGYSPFSANNTYKVYEKIAAGKYRQLTNCSSDLIEVIDKVLQPDLSRRFGNLERGARDIKDLRWFETVQWDQLLKKNIQAPIEPKKKVLKDTTNMVEFSQDHVLMANKYKNEFADF